MMMSRECAHPKISIHSVSQRAPLNSNVNYVTVIRILVHTKFLTRLKYLRAFIACTSTWISC